jgi:type 1 glutamine amidotransferase
MPAQMAHIAIAGGIYHDFEATTAVLMRRIETLGLKTYVFNEPEEALKALAAAPECLMLTVNALRFTMEQNEKYAPFRAEWALSLSTEGRRILTEFVRDGGALLGLHTASICFDDWPDWRCILGAQWRWGTSHHPAAGRVCVEVIDANEPLTASAHPFEVFDEVYHNLDVEPTARPLLRARMYESEKFQPVMWSHRYGRGRVIYDSLGHGLDSVNEPTHQMILTRAIAWLLAG